MNFSNLVGKTVLVIEDDYDQAWEVAHALQNQGIHVVGPYPTVHEGLEAARDVMLDAAVLDIRLRSDDSFPLADELLAQKVPIMFVTGYNLDVVPSRFKNSPRLLKPLQGARLPLVLSLTMATAEGRHLQA
jgi:CheY-like chemotaxis protein